MSVIMKCLVLVYIAFMIKDSEGQTMRKEAYLTVPQLITLAGYPVEKHRVKTEDGYSLQMHRIPAGRRTARRSGDENAKGKKVIFVCHGLVGSSGDFIIMGPERSLGYMLADAGYDVWLGNLRGTVYSAHQNMTRNDPQFWEYSWHEHGKYDVPAMIDKVLKVTGQDKLMYIGYSMGTTSFFVMMSERPEYNHKVMNFVALAPAVYMDNMAPIAELFLKTINAPATLRSRGMMSLSFRPELMNMLVGNICNVRDSQNDVCFRLVYMIVGEDYEQQDWDMAQIILLRTQPASWRQLEHFGKVAMTGQFTKWKDGLDGKVEPYNLSNVKVPVTILYGENDRLTDKSQIMRLANALNNTGMLDTVRPGCKWPKFNHLDFVFAKDVGKLLNKPLVKRVDQLFEKYGPEA